MQLSCELWSINRWLRWTGFRLFFEVDAEKGKPFAPEKPSRVGLKFWGWKDLP